MLEINLKKPILKILYNDLPCERCGSEKTIAKTWTENIETAGGVSLLEISQVNCKNEDCQAKYDLKRKLEIDASNIRKLEKEKNLQIRKENMAKTIAERKKLKKILSELEN